MEKNRKICHCCGNEIENQEYICIEKIWGWTETPDKSV